MTVKGSQLAPQKAFLPVAVLLPVSLLLLWVAGLLHYIDSPSEKYFRTSPVGRFAWYDSEEFSRLFGTRIGSWSWQLGNWVGLPAPWWVSHLSDGDTIVLRDGHLDLSGLRTQSRQHS